MPHFYKEVFSCFNISKTRPEFKTPDSFLKQTITYKSAFTYKGILFDIKSEILFTKHIFHINGKLKSLDDLSTVIQSKSI